MPLYSRRTDGFANPQTALLIETLSHYTSVFLRDNCQQIVARYRKFPGKHPNPMAVGLNGKLLPLAERKALTQADLISWISKEILPEIDTRQGLYAQLARAAWDQIAWKEVISWLEEGLG